MIQSIPNGLFRISNTKGKSFLRLIHISVSQTFLVLDAKGENFLAAYSSKNLSEYTEVQRTEMFRHPGMTVNVLYHDGHAANQYNVNNFPGWGTIFHRGMRN